MENAKLRCKMSYYRHYGGWIPITGEVSIYFLERCDKLEYYYIEFVEYGKIFHCYHTNYYIEGYPTLYVLSELINYCKDLKIELCVTDL